MRPVTDTLTIDHRGRPCRIEYIRHNLGRPENPVLVFLHEGLGAASSWKDIPQCLARATGCHAFAYSRPGYGRSDPAPMPRKISYLHTEALDILPAVLSAAGIADYILIGHSDGGSIGIIHTGSDGAGGAKGLVTLAAHLFCEPVTLAGIRKARENYLAGDLKSRLRRIHFDNTDDAFWGWNDIWLSPGFARWNIEHTLKGIRVPVMAIQGSQDPYGTDAQLKAMAEGLANYTIEEIEDCGHAPHLEKRNAVLQAMASFIIDDLGYGS